MPFQYLNKIACFETLRIYQGKIFCFYEHYDRFSQSCRGIGKSIVFSRTELRSWVKSLVKESGLPEAVLRLSLHWDNDASGVLCAILREFHSHPAALYEKGVEIKTTVVKRWTLRAQDPQIKSSQFIGGVLAHLDARNNAFHELVFLNDANTVAEGSISNLFIIKEKSLLTPNLASGILRGVTRGFVMALGIEMGLGTRELFLTRHDFYNADECFMTNTSSEILPVVRMDGRVIGNGSPGPWTKKLARAFKTKKSRYLE